MIPFFAPHFYPYINQDQNSIMFGDDFVNLYSRDVRFHGWIELYFQANCNFHCQFKRLKAKPWNPKKLFRNECLIFKFYNKYASNKKGPHNINVCVFLKLRIIESMARLEWCVYLHNIYSTPTFRPHRLSKSLYPLTSACASPGAIVTMGGFRRSKRARIQHIPALQRVLCSNTYFRFVILKLQLCSGDQCEIQKQEIPRLEVQGGSLAESEPWARSSNVGFSKVVPRVRCEFCLLIDMIEI